MRGLDTLRPRLAPQRTIAVDVDGTLLLRAALNEPLAAWCRLRKAEGYTLILWSARGEAHARQVADRFDLAALFDVIVSKPGYIVDDKGWSWIRDTRVFGPHAFCDAGAAAADIEAGTS